MASLIQKAKDIKNTAAAALHVGDNCKMAMKTAASNGSIDGKERDNIKVKCIDDTTKDTVDCVKLLHDVVKDGVLSSEDIQTLAKTKCGTTLIVELIRHVSKTDCMKAMAKAAGHEAGKAAEISVE